MRTSIIALFLSIFLSVGAPALPAYAQQVCDPTVTPTTCPSGICVSNGGDGGHDGTCQLASPTSNGGSGNVTLINPLQGQTLMGLLNDILTIVIQIGTIVIILMIVYVGFLFVVAQGKDAEITKARSALLWTVIGALILLGAQGLSLGIQATVHALGG